MPRSQVRSGWRRVGRAAWRLQHSLKLGLSARDLSVGEFADFGPGERRLGSVAFITDVN